MTPAPTVAVRGESTREVDPELATFSITVTARDRDRTAALAHVAERVARLRAVLDEYGPAIEKRETSRLSTWADHKRSGEKVSAARHELESGDAVLVTDEGKPVGVLTRADLLGFLSD